MPTYEYTCTECGDHVEAVQKFTDAPLTTCGSCGGRMRKVFSPVGVVFKGSGFYRTDSRASANGSSSTQKDNGEGPASEGSSESSSEGTGSDSGKQSADGKDSAKSDGKSGSRSDGKKNEKKSGEKASTTHQH